MQWLHPITVLSSLTLPCFSELDKGERETLVCIRKTAARHKRGE